ncbi:MAG: hypothetical protein IPK69_10085 [Phycisphaerales bacterium]|nr:MAG: hypothetical protein IPK69_10085 [Phycisphaerales bacterium]
MSTTPRDTTPLGPPTRTVVLLHEMPDASPIPTHLDWLLELPLHCRPDPHNDPNSRSLLAFRLKDGTDTRPDRLQPSITLSADRLDNHRALYLFHQGPLPPPSDAIPLGTPRGSLTRLATGEIHWKSLSENQLEFIARWPLTEGHLLRVHEYAATLTREPESAAWPRALPPGVLARFVLVTHKP